MIRGWHISQHLTQSLTLKPLETALGQIPRDPIILIKVFSIFQMRISHCLIEKEGVLGRTDMLKDLSARSRKKNLNDMTTRARWAFYYRCIITNALTRR